jgi:hypothetical protein
MAAAREMRPRRATSHASNTDVNVYARRLIFAGGMGRRALYAGAFSQMSRFVGLVFILSAAMVAHAATEARDAYVPIAGRAAGAGGRRFDTTVWITNVSAGHASVTLSFLRAGQSNPTPFTYTQRLRPAEIRRIVLPQYLVGSAGVGALRVRSTADVLTTAHLYSVVEGESEARAVGASVDAVPAENAIGSNETTLVQGVATPGARYKLYAVETTGHPLYFVVTLIDGQGTKLGQKRYFIGAREARTFDIPNEFPNAIDKGVALRVHGMNGGGKIIACGVAVAAESQDSTAFAMSVPLKPRHRMPPAEMAAYAIAALAVAVAAVSARRRPASVS